MTLFEKYDSSINENVILKLKDLAQRNLGDTSGAFDSIFYVLLAGLIRRANSDMSTEMLVNQVAKNYDNGLKDFDLAKDFKDEKKLSAFVAIGENNLSQIFPSMKSQLLNLVIAQSKTSKEETIKYTGFMNSLLIKFLAEELSEEDTKDELMNYLKGHRDTLFERAPESLISRMIPALGMHDLRDMKMDLVKKREIKAKKTESGEDANSGVSNPVGLNKGIEAEVEYEEDAEFNKTPLFIIGGVILIGLLGYFLYQSKDEIFNSNEEAVSSIVSVENDTIIVDSLEDSPEPIVESNPAWKELQAMINKATLPTENEIRMETLSFAADSIQFSNPSNPLIDSLSSIFKTNPRFQIQIKGSHSGGDSQLAIKRAFHLKRELQNDGIDAIRIDAIADNEKVDFLKIRVISK